MADSAALWLPVLPELGGFGSALTKGVAKEAEKGGKSSGSRFGKAFGIAAAGVAGVAAAGTALYNVGKTFDDLTNTIRVGTGASGADLDKFVDNAKNVGTQVPHEFDAIGETVADVNTQMGLAGDDLETVSSQILEAGRILGEDVDISTLGQSLNAFGVESEDVSGSLDYLFNVSQATGIGMNDLANQARQAAPAADALGFSFEETAGMIGQLDNAGLDSGKMLQNMSRRMGDVAKEGEEPRETFNRVAGEIGEMVESGDRFAAQDLAGKAFGTRNAEQFIKALEDGTLNLEELTGAGEHSGDTILGLGEETMQMSEHWQIFKNEVLVALEPVASRVFGFMTDLVQNLGQRVSEDIIPAFEAFVGWLSDAQGWLVPLGAVLGGVAVGILAVNGAMKAWTFVTKTWSNVTKIAAGVQKVFNTVMKANPIGLVITAVTALVGALVWFFTQTEIGQELWSKFTDLMVTAWDWVTEKIGAGVTWLWENALEPFFNWVTDAWGVVSEWFSEQYESWIGPTFEALGDAALWVWEKALEPFIGWLGDAWANLTEWFSEAYESWISPVFDAFSAVALWIWEKVLEPVFGFIGDYWGLVLEGMSLYWEHVLSPVFSAIAAVAVWLWEKVLEPVFSWIGDHWHLIVDGMVWVWDHILRPAWDALAEIAMWLWEKVLEKVFTWIGDHWEEIVFGIKYAWEEVLKPAWDRVAEIATWLWEKLSDIFTWIGDKWSDMSDLISDVYHDYIKPVIDKFGDIIEGLKDRFSTAVDNIGKAWEGIKKIAAQPIIFVIRRVLNDGLIAGFNRMVEHLPGISELGSVPMPDALKQYAKGFAGGGYTGDGHWQEAAGVVHRGEYVIPKQGTNRLRDVIGWDGLEHLRHGRLPGYAGGGLVQPVRGPVTSGFGAGRGQYPHAGTDFAVPVGTPVSAALAGTVLRAGFGNVLPGRTGGGVYLGHEGNTQTYYGHLSRLLVKVGEEVAKGQAIALSGNTGNSTGPHLHFETHSGGTPLDPMRFLGGAAIPDGTGSAPGFLDPLAPFRAIGEKITDWVTDKFPDGGMMVDAGIGVARKGFNDILGWAEDKVTAVGDFFTGGDRDGGVGPVWDQLKDVAAQFGWASGSQWSAIRSIVNKESSGNPNAQNPHSSASGLFQLIAANRTADFRDIHGHGRDGLGYIQQRYGTPTNALAFHNRNNWYDVGGYVTEPDYTLFRDAGGRVPPGVSAVFNDTGRDELMLNFQDALRTAELLRGNGGGTHFYGDVHTQDAEQFAEYVETKRRRAEKLMA